MARPTYRVDQSDRSNPRIVRLPCNPGQIGHLDDRNHEGMMFGMAKEKLLEVIKQERAYWIQHWKEQRERALALTEQECDI